MRQRVGEKKLTHMPTIHATTTPPRAGRNSAVSEVKETSISTGQIVYAHTYTYTHTYRETLLLASLPTFAPAESAAQRLGPPERCSQSQSEAAVTQCQETAGCWQQCTRSSVLPLPHCFNRPRPLETAHVAQQHERHPPLPTSSFSCSCALQRLARRSWQA